MTKPNLFYHKELVVMPNGTNECMLGQPYTVGPLNKQMILLSR